MPMEVLRLNRQHVSSRLAGAGKVTYTLASGPSSPGCAFTMTAWCLRRNDANVPETFSSIERSLLELRRVFGDSAFKKYDDRVHPKAPGILWQPPTPKELTAAAVETCFSPALRLQGVPLLALMLHEKRAYTLCQEAWPTVNPPGFLCHLLPGGFDPPDTSFGIIAAYGETEPDLSRVWIVASFHKGIVDVAHTDTSEEMLMAINRLIEAQVALAQTVTATASGNVGAARVEAGLKPKKARNRKGRTPATPAERAADKDTARQWTEYRAREEEDKQNRKPTLGVFARTIRMTEKQVREALDRHSTRKKRRGAVNAK